MLRRLTERIFYIPDEPDTDRPILAGILGTDYLIMVDAGNSPDHAQIFLDLIEKATGRYPDLVALTHWHRDHTFGLEFLANFWPTFGQKVATFCFLVHWSTCKYPDKIDFIFDADILRRGWVNSF